MGTSLFVAAAVLFATAAADQNQPLPVWNVAKDYEIGRTGLGLSGPVGALVGKTGALMILDNTEPFFRLHDANGRQKAALVRRGGGPGELQHPLRLGWRNDSVWVYDANQNRITLYSPAGKYLASRTFAANPLPGVVRLNPIALLDRGGTLVVGATVDEDIARSRVTIPIAVVEQASGNARVVASLEWAHQTLEVKVHALGNTGQGYFDQPFSDDPLWAVAKDGRTLAVIEREVPVIGFPAKFTITILSAGGDTVARGFAPYKPVPLGGPAVDAAVADILRIRFSGDPNLKVDERDLRSHLYRPRFLPPAFSLNVGRDGTIWVRTSPPTLAPHSEYLVFDKEGSPLARLTIPLSGRHRLLEADLSRLWVSTDAEDGTPLVVAFRIVH